MRLCTAALVIIFQKVISNLPDSHLLAWESGYTRPLTYSAQTVMLMYFSLPVSLSLCDFYCRVPDTPQGSGAYADRSTGTLMLTEAGPEHSGTYKCIAENVRGSDSASTEIKIIRNNMGTPA